MQPAVVAHRGASAQRAEHTLDAYALAIDQGADAVECDVRLTRDGHLVCVHDRRVDRTSNGRGVVSARTLAQLSELDYGSWHVPAPQHADDSEEPPRPGGLLTLEALLGLVADLPGTTLFVETKHPVRYGGLVEAMLVAQLRRHGFADPKSTQDAPVVAMSFSGSAVRRIRRHAPDLPTVLLMSRLPASRRDGSLPADATHTGPGVHLLRADPDYVARAAAHGHQTYCWTVDDPADIELCQRLGVRYLATNTPAATRRHLER